MSKLKIMTAIVLAGLMLMSGITAFGEELQMSEPEYEEIISDDTALENAPEARNVILPTGGENVYSVDPEPDEQPETLNILLPYDISFDIVIATNSNKGIVASREFKIINKGENAATVKISSINFEIMDNVDFSISDTADLPEDGNNIYVELICAAGGSSEALPVMKTFKGDAYTYYLESEEIGTFRLDGIVNEFGDTPWSETTVRVTICFDMEEHGAVIGPIRAPFQAVEEDSDKASEDTSSKQASETESSALPEAIPVTEDAVEQEREQVSGEGEASEAESHAEFDKDDEREPEATEKETEQKTEIDEKESTPEE